MKTRQQLQAEFIDLRNSQMKKGSSTRDRNIYFDWLADSDILAQVKSDEELIKAIEALQINQQRIDKRLAGDKS